MHNNKPNLFPLDPQVNIKKEEDWKRGRLNLYYMPPRNYHLLSENDKEIASEIVFHLLQQYDICHVIFLFVLFYK